MEQQNMAYFSNDIGANGDSQYEQVGFHPSSNVSFHQSTQANYNNGSGGRRTALRAGGQMQQRQQHIVVQGSNSLPQRVMSGTSGGQQAVHVQLLAKHGNSPIPISGQQQHIIISAQPVRSATPTDGDGNPITTFMEYFVEPQQQPSCSSNAFQGIPQYHSPLNESKYTIKNKLLSGMEKTAEKAEKEAIKKARQAEAARQRYHKLTPEEKKELNLKRTLAQKRKKQREKEMAELESILRASNDIMDDPEVLDQLREKRMRAKWAEAARTRYHKMSEEERRSHNMRRRMKQMTSKSDEKEITADVEYQRRVKEANVKKAEAARQRYHRMSAEEKKMYNQRRTEAFRRRRMEEEALLAMPIGRINGEALDRAQQIVIRNAKRAEAARLRYQRMTPDQRRAYNQKRYTPKRNRRNGADNASGDSPTMMGKIEKSERDGEEYDALSSLEREVLRRTQQAQQALMRQRGQQTTVYNASPAGNVVVQSTAGQPSHLVHRTISDGSPRSQQQIIVQNSEIGGPQLQYTNASASNAGGRVLLSGGGQQGQQQQVTYVSSGHHAQRA